MDQRCLLCNNSVNIDTSVDIYNTLVKYSNRKLETIIKGILGPEVEINEESCICGKCYSLFKLYDQALWTAKNMERDICRLHQRTSKQSCSKKSDNSKINLPTEKINLSAKAESMKDKPSEFNLKPVTRTNISEKYSLKNYFESVGKINSSTAKNSKLTKVLTNVTVETNKKQNNTLSLTASNVIVSVKNTDFSILTLNSAEKKCKENDISGLNKDEIESDGNLTEPQIELTCSDKNFKVSKLSAKEDPFACPSCEKTFETKVDLRNHVKIHSELRPFMCEICGHSYRHKQALEIHVGMHNGINPFQCNRCGKCFTQKGTMMRHMLIHTGETPYQCEICGKRFVHHTSYNMHILSHTREKAYKCKVCNLSLLSTSHLNRHMRVHTGEKPYSCDICLKRFAQRYNLLTHQKTHNNLKDTSKNNVDYNESNSDFSTTNTDISTINIENSETNLDVSEADTDISLANNDMSKIKS